MKIGRFARQSVRYVVAILLAVLSGLIVQICTAAFIEMKVGNEGTSGGWSFNVPNVITICIHGSAVGCVAGAIAQKRGMLISAIAIFLTPDALMDAFYSRDILDCTASVFFSKAALWAWMALLPAVVCGHFAAKLTRGETTSDNA